MKPSPSLLAALLLALAVLSAGCGREGGAPREGGEAAVARAGARKPPAERCLTRAGAASLIRGFFGALNSGNRVAAERFVFDHPRGSASAHLLGFSLTDHQRRPERWRASRPAAVVERLSRYPESGQPWRLVRIGAFGSPGPRAGDGRWAGLLPVEDTAGADVEVSVGRRGGGGKVGFDCRTGRFYVWGMAVGDPSLTPPERAGMELDKPFVALDCAVPNSFRCDRLYFFFASERRLRLLGAWIDGREVRLGPPRYSSRRDRPGAVWAGTLRPAGLDDGEGPLELPADGRGRQRWIGREPVLVPVALWAATPSGRRVWLSFPRVGLASGHG